MRGTISALTLLVLAGCSDADAPEVLPATFQVIQGADQVATVAREVPQAVEVRVLDNASGPVPNYPINWMALDGGSAFAPVAYSGTDGIARQRWTLGTQAWEGNGEPGNGRKRQRLVARALHPETGAVLVDDTVVATARPDVATRIWLSGMHSSLSTHPVGSVGVFFEDQHGNWLAPCPGLGSWNDLIWWSADSSIAVPLGVTHWGIVSPQGDSMQFAAVRGIDTGTTSIGVTAACGPFTAIGSVTVVP